MVLDHCSAIRSIDIAAKSTAHTQFRHRVLNNHLQGLPIPSPLHRMILFSLIQEHQNVKKNKASRSTVLEANRRITTQGATCTLNLHCAIGR